MVSSHSNYYWRELVQFKRFKALKGENFYGFSKTTPHPEGSDRGGSAVESYNFRVVGGKVVHEYAVDVDEPEPFGLTPEKLWSKEQALAFVAVERERLLQSLAGLDELARELEGSTEYENVSWYTDEDEDDEEEDEDDENEED
jgi:hypothetical protein